MTTKIEIQEWNHGLESFMTRSSFSLQDLVLAASEDARRIGGLAAVWDNSHNTVISIDEKLTRPIFADIFEPRSKTPTTIFLLPDKKLKLQTDQIIHLRKTRLPQDSNFRVVITRTNNVL
jgi:hypothetical protein